MGEAAGSMSQLSDADGCNRLDARGVPETSGLRLPSGAPAPSPRPSARKWTASAAAARGVAAPLLLAAAALSPEVCNASAAAPAAAAAAGNEAALPGPLVSAAASSTRLCDATDAGAREGCEPARRGAAAHIRRALARSCLTPHMCHFALSSHYSFDLTLSPAAESATERSGVTSPDAVAAEDENALGSPAAYRISSSRSALAERRGPHRDGASASAAAATGRASSGRVTSPAPSPAAPPAAAAVPAGAAAAFGLAGRGDGAPSAAGSEERRAGSGGARGVRTMRSKAGSCEWRCSMAERASKAMRRAGVSSGPLAALVRLSA